MLPSTLVTAALLLLQCLGLLFFAKGFFPYKPVFHGYAPVDQDQPEGVFDRVIFMLVDALRSDFVFSNESPMNFTQSLIASGNAIPFTARAAPPTVTLPRIKGISTGSVPNFLDAVLNIAESDSSSSLLGQDNWLVEFKRRPDPGKLVMFGDDTWLKLFPGMFDRHDGTSSFFVSDFTEVDNNVTRHLDDELEASDWDVMILHYLGVDHIGHKGGPKSPFMPGKLQEMDGIVKRLYDFTEKGLRETKKSTLLVLCGDHGMNEAGNHGGSSAGETAATLLFASSRFAQTAGPKKSPIDPSDDYIYYSTVEQIDLVPSLSGLLGNPFPMNNIGILIPELLHSWTRPDQIRLLRKNAEQIWRILLVTFESMNTPVQDAKRQASGNDIDKIRGQWSQIQEESFEDNAEAIEILYQFLELGQQVLSRASSNYDMPSMITGLGITAWIATVAINRIFTSLGDKVSTSALSVLLVAYTASMFASSLVEEEHYLWYWIATAWFAVQFIQGARRRSVKSCWASIGLLTVATIMRHYNHTGQKYAGSYDIAQFFLDGKAPEILWALIILVHLTVFKNLFFYVFADIPPIIRFAVESGQIVPSLLVAITPISVGAEPLRQRARAAFLSVLICLGFHFISTVWTLKKDPFKYVRGFFHILEVFLIIQTSTVDIPMFLLFEAVHSISRRELTTSSPSAIAFSALIWEQVAFFATGNANSLAAIDLSNAYNGISGYSVVPVGILTFVGNFYGPIFFSLSGIVQLSVLRNSKPSALPIDEIFAKQYWPVIHAFYTVSLVAVMSACMFFRSHLFIWTVFSPKFLYSVGWFILQHVIIDTIVGLGVLCIGEIL